MTNRLLSVEEVAKRLGISMRTVRRLIGDGAIPTHRIGRSVRVSEDDLDRYIAASRRA